MFVTSDGAKVESVTYLKLIIYMDKKVSDCTGCVWLWVRTTIMNTF